MTPPKNAQTVSHTVVTAANSAPQMSAEPQPASVFSHSMASVLAGKTVRVFMISWLMQYLKSVQHTFPLIWVSTEAPPAAGTSTTTPATSMLSRPAIHVFIVDIFCASQLTWARLGLTQGR